MRLSTAEYVVNNFPPKVPWWRPISFFRRKKIVAQLMEILFCESCMLTLNSKYALPCGVHQTEWEKDLALAWLQIEQRGFTVDQKALTRIEEAINLESKEK